MHISTIVKNDKNLASINVRKQQYLNGLSVFFQHKWDIPIILIDNTTDAIDPDIEKVCVNTTFICYKGNKYGSINKGAGLIENWNVVSNILKQYKWIIHFEPRQLLTNNEVIINMINNPNNIFKQYNNSYYTGLFCVSTDQLYNFLQKYSAEYITKHSISIEYIIYDEIKNVRLIDKLQLLRFDAATNLIEEH